MSGVSGSCDSIGNGDGGGDDGGDGGGDDGGDGGGDDGRDGAGVVGVDREEGCEMMAHDFGSADGGNVACL